MMKKFVKKLLKLLKKDYKMNYQHKDLADGRWAELSFCEQMANIGSEVERALKWKEKGNLEYGEKAFFRALELFDLTIKFNTNQSRI